MSDHAKTKRGDVVYTPSWAVCACLDETGSRTVTVWERCERCHAFMRMPDALAAAQEPPAAECGCDQHRDPATYPWSAWLDPAGKDGLHRNITVAPSRGTHVIESDAQWVRDRLNAQEPPAADEFAGLTDVTRVLPVVAEFVEKHGRLPIDLAEATNGPQPPADGGDRDA